MGFKLKVAAQHSVRATLNKVRRGHDSGTRRVFRQFLWLEAGSVKAAVSRPAYQRVSLQDASMTHTVRHKFSHCSPLAGPARLHWELRL